MHLSPEIVVVGSHAPGLFIRVHRVPIAGETVMGWDYQEPIDGGKGSNQAIAAARLGARVSFVGCLGQDRLGDEGQRWLAEAGVDTSYLRRSETSATVGGFVILDDEGLPAIVAAIGANGDLTNEEVETALMAMRQANVMLTQFEIYPHVAVSAAKIARSLGMTTIVNPAPAPENLVDGLDAADFLTPNETEAKMLLGVAPGQDADPAELALELRRKTGANCVMVTVGERGVVAAESSGVWQVEPPVVKAIDTTGAGDAFNAGLAVGLIKGMTPQQAAQWGCDIAAFSVTKAGTIPIYPRPNEVQEFLAMIRKGE